MCLHNEKSLFAQTRAVNEQNISKHLEKLRLKVRFQLWLKLIPINYRFKIDQCDFLNIREEKAQITKIPINAPLEQLNQLKTHRIKNIPRCFTSLKITTLWMEKLVSAQTFG